MRAVWLGMACQYTLTALVWFGISLQAACTVMLAIAVNVEHEDNFLVLIGLNASLTIDAVLGISRSSRKQCAD